MTLARLDISFAVNQVCQFMHEPQSIHWIAVKRILRYLKGTLTQGLHSTKGPFKITTNFDAGWIGDPNERRSTSGYAIFLGSS